MSQSSEIPEVIARLKKSLLEVVPDIIPKLWDAFRPHGKTPDAEQFYSSIYYNDRYDSIEGFSMLAFALRHELRLKKALKTLLDGEYDRLLRLFSFAVLVSYRIRSDEHKIALEMIEHYKKEFSEERVFRLIEAIALSKSGNPSEMVRAVNLLSKMSDEQDWLDKTAAYIYHAEVVIATVDRSVENRAFDQEQNLRTAIRNIDEVFTERPELHECWSIRGRLLFHDKQYDSASQDISRAIESVNLSHYGYVETTARLRTILVLSQAYSEIARLEQQTATIGEEISREKTRSIEVISIFSALVALVISSSSLIAISRFTFLGASLMIVMLGGVLLLVLELMMVRLSRPQWFSVVIVIAALLLVFVGLWIGIAFPEVVMPP